MVDEFADEAKYKRAIEYFGISNVIKRFGMWVVTLYGIECLKMYYPIELSRVNESDWIRHMNEKTWVNIEDFIAALSFAKSVYAQRQKLLLNGRSIKVFLCHGKEDKPSIRDIYKRLLTIGADPWLDEEKLLPGQDWKLEISRALRKSDIILVCLSVTTVSKTGFVQREVKDAIDAAKERPEGQIFIIPARLDECTIPDSLQGVHWVDLYREDGFDKLIRALELRCNHEHAK